MSTFSVIILAAGKGTRMKSALPKPLHRLAHKPMLGYVVDAYVAAGAIEIVLVIGPDDTLTPQLFPQHKIVVQHERKGTGHATLLGLEGLTKAVDRVISAVGDQPFIRAESVRALVSKNDAVTVLAAHNVSPAYGRLVTNGAHLEKIVEYKDANEVERAITLHNVGILAFDATKAKELLGEVQPNNAANEYYVTETIAIARRHGWNCGYSEAEVIEAMGANSRADLSELENAMQQELRAKHMANGATLIDPDTVYFAHDTVIGQDVIIEPNVFFGSGVVVGNNVHIKAFSHIEGATIGDACEVGPFARIRPDTIIEEKAKIGNFVEVKKSYIGKGTKISHLSYVGDSQIGAQTNIGAGTITCNYDGFGKHKTTIGDNVFLASNTVLVAPVTMANNSMTAAGSVITKDVPSGDMAIARTRQENKAGWATQFRARKQKEKEEK